MNFTTMLSLGILAFLLYMILLLLYIKRAVRKEISKEQMRLLLRASVEVAREMYGLQNESRGEKVELIHEVLEDLVTKMDLEIDEDQFSIKERIRKRI